MSIYQYKAGLQNAASYQSSGTPFVTGSDSFTGVMEIEFPTVTKSITVHETDNNNQLFIYFHEDATDFNKYVVDTTSHDHGPVTLDVKCSKVFISGSAISFRVYASLTGIEAKEMFALTGSGITK